MNASTNGGPALLTPAPTPTLDRRNARGPICPTCRYAQDHALPHPCITNGFYDGRDLSDPVAPADLDEVTKQLLQHPARPITISDVGVPRLRIVDRSWCFCQCSTRAATPGPAGARS